MKIKKVWNFLNQGNFWVIVNLHWVKSNWGQIVLLKRKRPEKIISIRTLQNLISLFCCKLRNEFWEMGIFRLFLSLISFGYFCYLDSWFAVTTVKSGFMASVLVSPWLKDVKWRGTDKNTPVQSAEVKGIDMMNQLILALSSLQL